MFLSNKTFDKLSQPQQMPQPQSQSQSQSTVIPLCQNYCKVSTIFLLILFVFAYFIFVAYFVFVDF